MSRAVVSTTIAAPVARVFATLADLDNFQRAIPHVVGIEYLSERRSGTGTRFREIRSRHGRRTTTELEITECVPDDRIRMVTESHGTIWDSLFELRETDGGTRLTVTLDAKAHQLLARLMNPTVMPVIQSVMESDLELLKKYCEEAARD